MITALETKKIENRMNRIREKCKKEGRPFCEQCGAGREDGSISYAIFTPNQIRSEIQNKLTGEVSASWTLTFKEDEGYTGKHYTCWDCGNEWFSAFEKERKSA